MIKRARIFLVLFISTIFLLGTVSPTLAASDQGLSWGVSVGDEYMFLYKHVDYSDEKNSRAYNIIVKITDLPEIPENITAINSLYYFPIHPKTDVLFLNRSPVGSFIANLPQLVWPVGNWSLWSNLSHDCINASYSLVYNSTATESKTTWSYTYTAKLSDLTEKSTLTFDKATGVLNRGILSFYWKNTPLALQETERITSNPAAMSVLIVGGSVFVGILAVALIIQGYRWIGTRRSYYETAEHEMSLASETAEYDKE
ncbi:MAG: hypothetical protein K9W43_12820 [Candidatus Thorarchaeota archaeon]|nr:hypothetical protein [Candidatus Thorarchaeota archaeon]